ncbi:MAG TPA: membrane protein insertion efficiency factor YidD [Oligoflexia bacterium]|nr:membrane protein insertion efficiency factor YidD [Oligoflexia bacterium]HMP48111.1 membrane protein insertion efficiency factor YidD [Oligoflexia bacterium]
MIFHNITLAVLGIMVSIWKWISFPLLGNRCRFHPACSDYFLEATQKYGLFKGVLIGLKRIFRCHPFSGGGGGVDPVP